ncbi:RNA polymerase sigma factor [Arenimonas sp.]|nr:RNA polymerase sigma factor [Candidatus Parcubacteria bacterium]
MKQQDKITKEFTDLYNSQTDALFRYCFFRMSDREQAKDIIQEAFMRVWDMLRKDVEVNNLRALLFKVTSNLVIDWYRKKKAISLDSMMETNEGDQGLQISDESFEQIEIQSEGKILLTKIQKLDSTYQQVVYLRFVEDLSPKEIASIVNLSVNVVSVRINRGIEILKKKYEK